MSDVFTTKVNVGLIFQPTEMMKVGNLSKFVWNQSLSVFYDQFWNLNLCKVWLGQQHKTSKYWIVVAETLFLLSKDSNAPFENDLSFITFIKSFKPNCSPHQMQTQETVSIEEIILLDNFYLFEIFDFFSSDNTNLTMTW